VLIVRDISSGYGLVQVLWNVSIDVNDSEVVCLIGSNGAGKSTLLRTITGAVTTTSGSIEFDGVDLRRRAAHDIVVDGIALVPEGRRLFQTMSVRENLLMGAYRQRDSKRTQRELDRVLTLFPILAERRSQAAGTLSGGEQQMCAIGRGLMSCPRLLLIDELSLGLAPRVVDLLTDTIITIRKELGIAILLVEQDVDTALRIADRGFLMDTGRIALAGTSAELMSSPMVGQAYVGG
jgi:branched-chain amino acid transport system ATP-binding protein